MKKKQKNKKAFWKNIKFKYKLTITNENTMEELIGIHVSKLNGFSVLLSTLTILFLIAACIIAFTPLRNYLPGYMNSNVRELVVQNALRADSLIKVVNNQNLYIMNIQDIFEGNVKADTVHSIDSLTALRSDTLLARSQRETKWRKEYEKKEKYNLNDIDTRSSIEGLTFYSPVRGMIAKAFSIENHHYGTDIAADENSSVQATLDGTVILSTYTAENGYVIAIQHNKELISVYKQCGSLLKQTGETVKAGEPIALVGQNKMLDHGNHLHFELWRKGKAINPENYIVF